ncbi:hypothetical protein ACOMHN_000350 [Nucella lapillus]
MGHSRIHSEKRTGTTGRRKEEEIPVIYTGTSASGRVLLVAWLLLSLVTVATYRGKLTSNSVVTKQPVPFKTLSELVRRSDYKWGFPTGTMLDSLIGNSTNKDYQKFYQKMLEFEKTDPAVRSRKKSIYVPKIMKEKYVRLTSDIFYKFYRSKGKEYCRMTVARERVSQDTYVVYFQKGSPYKQMFDEIIAHAMDMGILEHLSRKWFPEQSDCQEDGKRVMSVSLQQVPLAFLMAAAGMMLALGLLILELIARNSASPAADKRDRATRPACLPQCCM